MGQIVPAVGPRDAKIAIVGEAPGADEVRAGEPFVGASGRLLNQMLANAGIDRKQCYLTNVVQERPQNNDFGQFYLDKRRFQPSPLLEASTDRLKREMVGLRPNVIIPLGAEPLRAISGRRGIDKWRGSIISSPVGKLVPTYHPAYILRVYEDRPIAELDLRRAAAESTHPSIDLPRPSFILQPSFDQVMDWIQKQRGRVAFDIETNRNHTVRCLGLSAERNRAICIPFSRGYTGPTPGSTRLLQEVPASVTLQSYWSEEEEYEILRALNKFFLDPEIEKVAQNFPFDATVLALEFGFHIRGLAQDTMVAAHTCYPEFSKGLDFLASIWTRIPYYSDYDAAVDLETWTYNCWDACATLEISERLDEEMQEQGLDEFYSLHLQPAVLAYTQAQNRGICVDIAERTRQAEKMQAEIIALTDKIRSKVGLENFNPSSPKQVGDYLYGKLRLAPVYNHKTKKVTVDKNAMESLANKYTQHEELFNTIKEHGSKENLYSGFLTRPLGPDQKIRTSLSAVGTVTGRCNSSETFLWPSTNLQNIQKPGTGTMRRCFVADPGWLMLKADYSQAEFRIVVWLAKITRLIERYKVDPSFDVHRWVASLIYKCREDQVTKPQRDIAKNGVYGGNYKMGYRTAARTYHLSFQMAKFVLDSYISVMPEIPRWWQGINDLITSTRTIVNPFGRKRLFLGRLQDQYGKPNEDVFRAAYSHYPQSMVGDWIHRSAAVANEIFDSSRCHLLHQVHDELVFNVRPDQVERHALLLKTIMEYPVQIEGVEEPLVVPADISVGPNWLDQQKVELS